MRKVNNSKVASACPRMEGSFLTNMGFNDPFHWRRRNGVACVRSYESQKGQFSTSQMPSSAALLVHFLTASSQYVDHPMLHASFRRCCVSCDKRVDKLHKWPTVSSCMSGCALQFLSWPSNADAIRYFYHPNNMSRFRLPGCNSSSRHARGTGSYKGDLIWEPYPNQPCLWSNMPFGKLLANILFMRAFDVTHLIESGRMGGLSLVRLPAPTCTQHARYLPSTRPQPSAHHVCMTSMCRYTTTCSALATSRR